MCSLNIGMDGLLSGMEHDTEWMYSSFGGIVTSVLLQIRAQQPINEMGANIIAFIPDLIGAIFLLIIGGIIGWLLGEAVTSSLQEFGLGRFVRGTPLDTGDGERLSGALGSLVKYFVYYLALLAAAGLLGIRMLSELLSNIGGYLPTILGAAALLIAGFVVGRVLEDIVADLVGDFGIDPYLEGTPLEGLTKERGLGGLVGQIVAIYVYFVTIIGVADTLNILILTQLMTTITAYIPELVGALVILLVGIWLGDWASETVADADTRQVTNSLGTGVKVLIYYISITITLQTAGFDASILITFFTIVVGFAAAAIAIAFIIAVGVGGALGSQDYIADNIADWVESAQESVAIEESNSEGAS
jgi:hypothetical protein